MGRLLSTGFAILVAYWVVAPMQFASHFNTPRMRALKIELASEHAAESLWGTTKAWAASLPKARPAEFTDLGGE